MRPAVEFYFDFSSPYGYFASTRIDAVAARHGRGVTWHPVLLGVLVKATGMAPLTEVPLKGDYSRQDMQRSARLHGIPYNPPARFPIPTQAAARAFYWLSDQDSAAGKGLAQALFKAYYVDGRDISSPDVTLDVAAEQGVDRERLAAALQDPAVKDRLRSETEQALGKGVFGSPYFIVDGEPFWGMDRVDHVDRWLETGGW